VKVPSALDSVLISPLNPVYHCAHAISLIKGTDDQTPIKEV
jgi:hypothetical protein